jgi:predicted anti-sigma-YlaC factor YlaD
MSPEMSPILAERLSHERARILAAESVDLELEPKDTDWLAGHLSACAECRSIADEYGEIHAELRSLAMPEPPRDLWAQTAAALDHLDARSGGRSRAQARAAQVGRRPLIGTSVAVGLVLVVTAVSVMSQSPVSKPVPASTAPAVIAAVSVSASATSGAPVAPLAVVDGTSYWLSAGDGVYQIKGGSTQCTTTSGGCTVGGDSGQTLGSISSDSAVSAVIAPDALQAAVWTDDKVAIMPLGAQTQTVVLNLLTPGPTIAATASPTAVPTPTPTAPIASAAISPLPSSAESAFVATAAPTAAPTATPVPTPTIAPAAVGSIAILFGYQIVGRDPEFSPDGTMVAFAARPADHSTGPDVFVWRSGQQQARPITFRHSGLFAGWFGGQVLVSEISARSTVGAGPSAAASADTFGAASYLFDPATDTARRIRGSMLLPAVDPSGRYLVYWTGTAQFDPASGLWQPGSGELYFDAWSDLTLEPASLGPESGATASPSPLVTPEPTATVTAEPSATPSESAGASNAASGDPGPSMSMEPSPTVTERPVQPPSAVPSPTVPGLPRLLPVASGPGAVSDWVVRWDRSGGFVAIWVANPSSTRIGRLTLFSIDIRSGIINVNEPRLSAEKVLSSVSFDESNLVYTSAVDGKTYMQALPAVPPSKASTPEPTLPGQLASDAVSAVPSAPASDRPGS